MLFWCLVRDLRYVFLLRSGLSKNVFLTCIILFSVHLILSWFFFIVVPRQKYCESLHKTVRRKTSTVMVGNVALGSEHPIRIQTMTTTDTKDIAGTVEQVIQLLILFCSNNTSFWLIYTVMPIYFSRYNCLTDVVVLLIYLMSMGRLWE